MEEFLSWYLAPWRRIGRGPFNTIVFCVAVPGMLLWFMGLGENMGGVGGFLTSFMDVGNQLQRGDSADLTAAANTLLGQAPAGAQATGFVWGDVGGWVDTLLWLLCFPLVRMRVRDVGHQAGAGHWLWVAAAFVGTVPDLLAKMGLPDLGMAGSVASVVSFVALLILCVKGTVRVAREEDFPAPEKRERW